MMADNDIMPFGMHKGKKMCNVPAGYLVWIYENDRCGKGDVRKYIKDNLEVLKTEIKRNDKK